MDISTYIRYICNIFVHIIKKINTFLSSFKNEGLFALNILSVHLNSTIFNFIIYLF